MSGGPWGIPWTGTRTLSVRVYKHGRIEGTGTSVRIPSCFNKLTQVYCTHKVAKRHEVSTAIQQSYKSLIRCI